MVFLAQASISDSLPSAGRVMRDLAQIIRRY